MQIKKRMIKKLLIAAMAVTMLTGSGMSVTANAVYDDYYYGYNYTVVEEKSTSDFEYNIIRYENSYMNEIIITNYIGTSENVVIPEQIDGLAVTAVGDRSKHFDENTIVKSIVIAKTVKKVDATAFLSFREIREITVPDSVTEINFLQSVPDDIIRRINEQVKIYGKSGSYAEEYLTGLGLNFEAFTNDSDFTYEVNGRINLGAKEVETITLTGYSNRLENLEIPPFIDGKLVTEIGQNVFTHTDKLKSVIIPETVRFIRTNAFYDCYNLESVTIPETVSVIENMAFSQPFGAIVTTTIKGTAGSTAQFYSQREGLNFEELAEDTTNYEEIFDIEPNGSNMIYNSETGYYEYVNFIKIKGYKGESRDVVIPSRIGTFIVNEIGESAFANSNMSEESISSVVIPYTVQKIGNRAFWGTFLTNIDIPQGVFEIGDSAFESCYFLRRADISDTVSSVGQQAFDNCGLMTDLRLSKSITEIKDSAFRNCNNIESVIIPNGVKKIGASAFSSCRKLKSAVIPESVQTIGEYAFESCALEEINLQKVTDISMSAFRNTGLKSVVIPESVTEISQDLFSNSLLQSITIPKTVQKIDFSAFSFCYGLSEIKIAEDNPYFTTLNGVVYNKGKTELLYHIDDESTEYSVPESVAKIGDYAFCASKLNKVNLTDKVKEIGKYAFALSQIKSINIPSGITVLKEGTFRDCENLESINIPDSVTEIGEDAFWYCTKLKEINLPSKLTTIGDSAFYHTGLTSVSIPDSVTNLERRSFAYCTDLESVRLSKNIGTVKRYVFEDCRKLVSITIPSGVTEIGSYAFGYCSKLNQIFIPDSVTKIDTDTFRNSNDVVIYGKSDSYAKTYADNKGIDFVPLTSLKITSSVSKSTVKKGESITVNAQGTGGTVSKYTYAFYYKKSGDTSWKTLQGFKENSFKSFKPASAGTYSICAKVQDEFGTIAKKYFTVKVINPLINCSTIEKTSIKTGETVTLNGLGAGGTEYYQYAFYSKPATSNKWTELQSYGTKSTYNLKPDKGTYDICIKVKDSSGTVEKKYLKLTVTEPLENNSVISASSIKSGGTLKVTAKADGGTGTYSYASYYKLTTETKWTENQSYSSNSSVAIKPTVKGTYDLCIKVKDSNGTVAKKYFTFTVK